MQYIACIEVIEKKLNGSASLKLEILEEWLMVINVLHYQRTNSILLLLGSKNSFQCTSSAWHAQNGCCIIFWNLPQGRKDCSIVAGFMIVASINYWDAPYRYLKVTFRRFALNSDIKWAFVSLCIGHALPGCISQIYSITFILASMGICKPHFRTVPPVPFYNFDLNCCGAYPWTCPWSKIALSAVSTDS